MLSRTARTPLLAAPLALLLVLMLWLALPALAAVDPRGGAADSKSGGREVARDAPRPARPDEGTRPARAHAAAKADPAKRSDAARRAASGPDRDGVRRAHAARNTGASPERGRAASSTKPAKAANSDHGGARVRAVSASPASAASADASAGERWLERADVASFIQAVAKADGFAVEDLRELFTRVRRQQRVIDAMSRPLLQPPKWHDYARQFLTRERIEGGTEFWRAPRPTTEYRRK